MSDLPAQLAPPPPANDNHAWMAGLVPIIGTVDGAGRVTITDPLWRPRAEAD